jgi:hypothetical protein
MSESLALCEGVDVVLMILQGFDSFFVGGDPNQALGWCSCSPAPTVVVDQEGSDGLGGVHGRSDRRGAGELRGNDPAFNGITLRSAPPRAILPLSLPRGAAGVGP